MDLVYSMNIWISAIRCERFSPSISLSLRGWIPVGRSVIQWQKRLIEHGYAARTIPSQYGGYGADPGHIEVAHHC